MSKNDISVLNKHKNTINTFNKKGLNCMSCPEIAIHKPRVYGTQETGSLCCARA
jgi:hypothetical protein